MIRNLGCEFKGATKDKYNRFFMLKIAKILNFPKIHNFLIIFKLKDHKRFMET